MPVNLSKREAQRLGILPPDVPTDDVSAPRKPAKWGSGVQAPEVAGWSARKAVVEGLAYPGAPIVHRWQVLDAKRWLARCGRERARTGWLPVQGQGEPCKVCFADKGVQDDA